MPPNNVEAKLHALTNSLVNELIALTPETMSEIQFEIVSAVDFFPQPQTGGMS